jgi:hypothetical protein
MTLTTSYRLTVPLLFLLLFVACAPNTSPSEESELPNTPVVEKMETTLIGVDTTPLPPAGGNKIKSKKVEQSIPAWREKSPFKDLIECKSWKKNDLISASCCKKVTAFYAGLKANPGSVDIASVETQDPFLSSCRLYNKEFETLIDNIMFPPLTDSSVNKVPF